MTSVPPPSLATRSEVPDRFEVVLDAFRAALHTHRLRSPSATVAWGPPEEGDGQWLALDDFVTDEGVAPAIARFPPTGDYTKLYGHWTFQRSCGTALLVAGYLFATQRRVPVLRGNVLLQISDWLQHVRFVQPRLWVLPDDPLCGADGVTTVADQAALAATLLAEVRDTYEPIIQAFQEQKYRSAPNTWASVVDGLCRGFVLAGRADLGADAMWELWHTTTAAWDAPTRRWPRRVPFVDEGVQDEVIVGSACCLIFAVPDANGIKPSKCPNCPIRTDDAARVRWLANWLKEQTDREQAVAAEASGEA